MLLCITEKPVSQRHISWSYREDCEYIMLDEIVENTYRHPEVPELATIPLIERFEVKRLKKIDSKAASIMLLKNALDNCTQVNGTENLPTWTVK